MMKQKLIIGLSLLIFIIVVTLIVLDLFKKSDIAVTNDYEYNLDKYKEIDSSLICYNEISKIKINLPELNGIAVDSLSNVYIVANDEVQILNRKFERIAGFATDSTIHSLALNKKLIYLGVRNHIEVYNYSGKQISKWEPFTEQGYISSIKIKKGFVYVADLGNKLVLKYNLDGKLITTIGKKNKEKGINGCIIPSTYFDIAFGTDNNLWMVNPGMHKIQKFSTDGDLLDSWGTTSMDLEGFSGCCNPVHFDILPDGKFVTFEKGLDRMKIHDQTGKFECVVATADVIHEKAINQCTIGSVVRDITSDRFGTIYIVDVSNNLRVFKRK